MSPVNWNWRWQHEPTVLHTGVQIQKSIQMCMMHTHMRFLALPTEKPKSSVIQGNKHAAPRPRCLNTTFYIRRN